MKTLHALRVHHMLGKGGLAKSMTLPPVYAKLSDLIPSKNRLSRNGSSWAKDIVKISFQGIEIVDQNTGGVAEPTNSMQLVQGPQSSAPGSQPMGVPLPPTQSTAEERSVLVTEARMVALLPKALLNINNQVDKDIVFNSETGSFAFRLRTKIGESVIPDLVECLVRIERLVEFVQVLGSHGTTLTCKMVSLGKIIFTYQEAISVSPSHGLDLSAGNAPDAYEVTVDFSATDNNMALVLEKGNPHLRISDSLASVLNSSEGLNGVATFLPLTLHVLRGLDAIENAWSTDDLVAKGEVIVHVRATDSYLVRYSLFQTSSSVASPLTITRKVSFEIKLRSRKSKPWWHVRRVNTARLKYPDALDEALMPVWALSPTPEWVSMRNSAVAQNKSIEHLLIKLDETVRNFALNGKNLESHIVAAPPPPARAQTSAPPKPNPGQNPRQYQQQQQRQQPPPNSNQSQQGRSINNPQNRVIVEID